MELGEKIRLARTSLGLSQRQLCGDTITRNMLSQIESGKARPSMTTLQYLAINLDKPMSYFLEDGDSSPSDTALANARQAFGEGCFQQALDALESCREKSQEAAHLEYLCLLELGKNACAGGKLPYARQLLLKAGGIHTVYKTQPLEHERQLLLLEAEFDGEIPSPDRSLLLKAQRSLAQNDHASAIRYLDACDHHSSRWALLRGNAALLDGNFSAALQLLKQAEADFPRQAIPMLETCCKELEDYKQAYYYACLQR